MSFTHFLNRSAPRYPTIRQTLALAGLPVRGGTRAAHRI